MGSPCFADESDWGLTICITKCIIKVGYQEKARNLGSELWIMSYIGRKLLIITKKIMSCHEAIMKNSSATQTLKFPVTKCLSVYLYKLKLKKTKKNQ